MDADTCDDCSNTGADGSGGNVEDDGRDTDDDGVCDAGEVAEAGPDLDDDGIVDAADPDVDGDGVPNGDDSAPVNPQTCGDLDRDTCDDCANTGADQSGGDVADDGPDADEDGICDAGETEPEPVDSFAGVHVQGGGFNCSLRGGATHHRHLGWPLALLLGLALRRRRSSRRSSSPALNR